MKIIVLLFLSIFLFSCGNNTSQTSGSGIVQEEKEDPADITTQKWYKERIQTRENDLEKFFSGLDKFPIDQQAKLPCDEYYPTKGEYFDALYDIEKEMIGDYFNKCKSLKESAREKVGTGSTSNDEK